MKKSVSSMAIPKLRPAADLVQKSGAWYAYEGEKIGQGRENAKLYLAEHPDVMTELENKVRELHGLSPRDAQGAKGKYI